mmetsp:Transcript_36610/g.68129  ORF Transcript_36610/g.68129 Transcript_36610/m.68129 type:complete len:83 (+) Transcript_36610:222-470(+)
MLNASDKYKRTKHKNPLNPVQPRIPVMTPPTMQRKDLVTSICFMLFCSASIEIRLDSSSLIGFMMMSFVFGRRASFQFFNSQ